MIKWVSKSPAVVVTFVALTALSGCNKAQTPDPTFRFHHASTPVVTESPTELPSNTAFYKNHMGDGLLVVTPAFIDESCLKSLTVGKHPSNGSPILNFTLKTSCAETLAQETENNTGRRFAVVINNTLMASPTIGGPLVGGSLFIQGPTQPELEAIAAQFDAKINRQ